MFESVRSSVGLLAACAGIMSAEAPVRAEPINPISVGILDIEGDRIVQDDPSVGVVFRSFLPPEHVRTKPMTKSGLQHGVIVASVAAEAIRSVSDRPVRIYSADVFVRRPMRTPDGRIRAGARQMDVEAAMRALEWFDENGVRVVVMAFVDRDSEGLRSVVGEIQRRGMIPVAGVPNVVGSAYVYPAAYEGVVSVAGLGRDLPASRGHYPWATIRMSGLWRGEVGSSIASARAAGLLAVHMEERNLRKADLQLRGYRVTQMPSARSDSMFLEIAIEQPDGGVSWSRRMAEVQLAERSVASREGLSAGF